MATEDTPVVVATLKSLTREEVPPEGATEAVEEPGAGAEMGISVCVDVARPELDEGGFEGTVGVAVDNGSVGAGIETFVDGVEGANGVAPSSSPGALDEAREAAPEKNIVVDAGVDGVILAEPEDQLSALNAEEEAAADLPTDLAERGVTEQASAPAVERATEPKPDPAAQQAKKPDVDGLADLVADTVVEKGPATTENEALVVNTVLFLC